MSLNNVDKVYHELIEDILTNGTTKNDRTGTGTISVFGRQIRFNLEEGFPLLTTKKMWIPGIIHELLWFLNGDTNIKYLVDNNVHIWDDWAFEKYKNGGGKLLYDTFISKIKTDIVFARKHGKLGPIYGHEWVNWPIKKPVMIKKIIVDDRKFEYKKELLKPNTSRDDDLIGKEFLSNKSNDEFIVIDKLESDIKNSKYMVQFKSNGYITEATRPNIRKGMVLNRYKSIRKDGGVIGKPNTSLVYYNDAYNLWSNMMNRCYNEDSLYYKYYGAKGVVVDSRWQCFEYFLEDIPSIPNFTQWLYSDRKYDLDKDTLGGTGYSKETTIFLEHYYNLVLRTHKPFIAINNILGVNEIFISIKDFSTKFNLPEKRISDAINKEKMFDGWTFEKVEYDKENYTWSYSLGINQIQNAIDTLKSNPDSRRIMVSAWNVGELDDMALLPCHYAFQFYTTELTLEERIIAAKTILPTLNHELLLDDLNGFVDSTDAITIMLDDNNIPTRKLSLKWNQRSVDTGLGLPYNIASYAFLTHMVAQQVNMVPGELIGDLGDTHIYLNHVDKLKEQLTRNSYDLPKLELNKANDIFSYKFSDFKILDYESHPTIKMDISV